MNHTFSQPEGLIGVLLDVSAGFGDRHDAAMDLGNFDDRPAEEALATVGSDPVADEDLADACGESLAEIWCRRNSVDSQILLRLAPVAIRIAVATLQVCSPQLAKDALEILGNAGNR